MLFLGGDTWAVGIATPKIIKANLRHNWESTFGFGKPFIRYAALRFPSDQIDVVTKLDHGLHDGTLLRIFADHFQQVQRQASVSEVLPFKHFAFHIYGQAQEKVNALRSFTAERHPLGFHYPEASRPNARCTVKVSDVADAESLSNKSGCDGPYCVPGGVSGMAVQSDWSPARWSGLLYLYTGRNVNLRNAQEINGCTANFEPMQADMTGAIKDYLRKTQDEFWETTEHGVFGLDEICAAASLGRETRSNRSLFLFLFQPFAPPSTRARRKWPGVAVGRDGRL